MVVMWGGVMAVMVGRDDRREVMGEVEIKVWDGTCSTMNCACRSSRSSVKLVQPIDWGGTVV